MYPVRAKNLRTAPSCLLHPGAEIRWVVGRRSWSGRWSCDGCVEASAKQKVKTVILQRTRPARPLDERTAAQLLERIFALAIPAAIAWQENVLDAAEKMLDGLVPDLEKQLDRAHDLVAAARRERDVRYGCKAWVERDDVEAMAALGREDAAAGARDLRAAWGARRVEFQRGDTSRDPHPYPWAPEQLAGMKGIYLAYAADEVQRRLALNGRARLALPIARGLLTKTLLVLPEEWRYQTNFFRVAG